MKTLLRKILDKPELVFVFIATFFGLLAVFLMPVLAVPDENQHFQVEYAFFSNESADDDLILNEQIILDSAKSGDYGALFSEKTSAEKSDISINTGSTVFDGKTTSSVFDIMRLPQAIGVLIGRIIYPSIGVMVIMGRLVNLAIYVLALYFIIKKVRYGKWVFLFISCLPMMIQQAASLSYDSNNLLVIFAWMAFMINTFTSKTGLRRKQIFIGLGLIALLAVSKANNLFLVGLLAAMPAILIKDTSIYRRLKASRHWKAVRYTLIITAAVLVTLAAFILFRKLLAGQDFDPRRLMSVLLNTFIRGDNLLLIDVVVNGMIGFFSNFYYHLPVWIVVMAFIVLSVILMHEKLPNVSKRFAIISGLLFIASVLLISIGMYYAWAIQPFRLGADAKVADGIQGRYFTPLLILLFPTFAYMQKWLRVSTAHKLTMPILAASSSCMLLLIFICQTLDYFWI